MKHKGFYALATAAMLALVAGCGSNQGEENPQNQITETATPTEAAVATATPEPTATPAPTATPKPANYMEANGIEVLGAGWHTCKGYIAVSWDEDPVLEFAEKEYGFEVTEEESEGGTKIIHATIKVNPYVNPTGGYGVCAMGGFVDIKTGKALYVFDEPKTILLKQEDKEYELQLVMEQEYPSVTNPYYTERYTLVCPADYEDGRFYLTGWDFSEDAFMSRVGGWKKLNYIQHGETDMAVFGVNKGLATEPEKKPADGAEFAEENFMEANGLSVQGEGTYTWKGMVALRKHNEEAGVWESFSLEEAEITTTVSITEESLGDGTKMVRGTFIEILEMVSEDVAKVPYKKYGIADKKTGLVYRPRTYSLAEPYVLEKDGEAFSILVGVELVEEDLGDGKVDSRTTFTLICPEDYNDAVFYLTADVELDEDEHTFSNEREMFSLNDVKHDDYDLMFFR